MKKFNFVALANVRTQKDEFSENIIATSVVGQFRVPPKPTALLGIKDFDAVSIMTDKDEETGVVTLYIGKGHPGTIKRDENGEIVTGSRNVTEFEESDPMDGAIVRATTEGSKVLTFTSSAAWKMIGGSKDKEFVLSLESIGEQEYPLPSGKIVTGEVFEMKVIQERAGAARVRKPKVEGEATQDDEVAAALEAEEFEEEEV